MTTFGPSIIRTYRDVKYIVRYEMLAGKPTGIVEVFPLAEHLNEPGARAEYRKARTLRGPSADRDKLLKKCSLLK